VSTESVMRKNTTKLNAEPSLIAVDQEQSERRPSQVPGDRRRLVGSVFVGAIVFLVSCASAAAAAAPAGTPKARLAPQYQAESRDISTGLPRGSTEGCQQLRAADLLPCGDEYWPPIRSSPQRGLAPGLRAWYQESHSRYRLPGTITASGPSPARAIAPARSSPAYGIQNRIQPYIKYWIASQNFRFSVISAADRPKQARAADKRRLLELAFALGLAYVAFLAGWFWKTRGRPHGAERVVRF
jgi:hypothetical protein